MRSNFNKWPFVEVPGDHTVYVDWKSITDQLRLEVTSKQKDKVIIVVEYYQGVIRETLDDALKNGIDPDLFINAKDLIWPEQTIKEMVWQDVTDDRIFGYLTRLTMNQFFDPDKIDLAKNKIKSMESGTILIVGSGATLVWENPDILVYADMARWEVQLRMRRHLIDNLGVQNRNTDDWMLLYKQGFFVDWRVCDRLKKQLMARWDYLLDTNNNDNPKMVFGPAVLDGFRQALNRPFSVVPFFDPGPWGGQWMKEYCNLDKDQENYAWCFNCVPEENSLLLKIADVIFELPSIDLVFFDPGKLLGDAVHARFGDEFPIRFDFLDTIEGGNLSLQVHPLTEYIQEKFGMHYTQDESYYMLEARDNAVVYLGFKDEADQTQFVEELETAQRGGPAFEPEKFVNTWPVKKHDHFLIPAGTIHCSGKNSMVLEISATPYIFTFKLWDWGRLGMDGKPRPINIEHGKSNLQWDRQTNWVRENLVNRIEKVAEGDGWIEERTGLHEREFIETRRHWFTKKTEHHTGGTVNVLNLVEGDEVIVESPEEAFEPFVVHYAETFIVPATVGAYSIRPHGKSVNKQCATVKAFVRHNP